MIYEKNSHYESYFLVEIRYFSMPYLPVAYIDHELYLLFKK